MIPTTSVVILLLLLLGLGNVVDVSLVSSSRLRRQDVPMSVERRHLTPQEPQAFAERSNTTSQESKVLAEGGHQLPQKAQLLAEMSHPPPQESQALVERRYLPPQVFVGKGDLDDGDPLEPAPSDGPRSAWLRLLRRTLTQYTARRMPQHFLMSWLSNTYEGGGGKLYPAAVTRRGVAKQLPEPWYSVDTWLGAFQSSFKRDMILNVGKVGTILLLYYLAPDLLAWIDDNFGLG